MRKKKEGSRKIPSRGDLIGLLRDNPTGFRPLTVSELSLGGGEVGNGLDATVGLAWKGRKFRFGVKAKSTSTPKAITATIDEAREECRKMNLNPLVLVPYLAKSELDALMEQEVSGLDLCGNGVVTVPGRLLLYRTGFPNKYPRNAGIKNIYQKESSIVARVFLLQPSFRSVGDVLKETIARGGDVTLATVSKVCAELDNDLIIERRKEAGSRRRNIRLLQPEKLLEGLARNYSPPEISREYTGKWVPGNDSPCLRDALRSWAGATGQRVVHTGASSTSAYAVMAREPIQTFYCSDAEGASRWLDGSLRETSRFANVRLLETRSKFVYFDRREDLAASPIQVYLELMAGDKRDHETAEQVRRLILEKVEELQNEKTA